MKLILERFFFNFILSTIKRRLFKLNMQYFLFIFTLVLLLENSLVSINPNISWRASNMLFCCYCENSVVKSIL